MEPRYLWAGISIVFMWVAVGVVGVFGESLVREGLNDATRIPVVVIVAALAVVATVFVARWGFRE
jgi:high-affinity Fe2+/Pb2+ permease